MASAGSQCVRQQDGTRQARSGKSARVDGVANYVSTTPRPAMCNGGASKLKSAEVLRLSTARSVGARASTATRTWDNQHVGLSVRFDEHVATNFAQSLLNPIFRFVGGRLIEVR